MNKHKKRKKILILCPYPVGVAPGQRLKYEQYFAYWYSEGYDVNISSFMTDRFWRIVYKKGYLFEKVVLTIFGYFKRIIDLIRIPFYDGCYVFLWITPFGLPLFEYLFNQVAKKYIYDIDDMVFLGHVSKANWFVISFKGRSKMIYLMKNASHVITCTPRLNKFVSQYNFNTTDISSTINTENYVPIISYVNKEVITLGWSGSHSTSKYLHLLDDVLTEISKYYNIRLLVIGDSSFDVQGVEVKSIEWSEDTEVRDLKQIDIGLYPLPDEEWVYGKSGLKALQYMGLGIPTIASKIGANKRIINDGIDGFLVKSQKDWLVRIIELIENVDLRKEIGQEARKKVELKFSVEANKEKYINILNKVYQ